MSYALENPLFNKNPSRGRQYKLLQVSTDLLFSALFNLLGTREQLSVPAMGTALAERAYAASPKLRACSVEGIPDDAEIEGVFYDEGRLCWSFTVWSSTFNNVEPCQPLPYMDVTIYSREIQILSRIVPNSGKYEICGEARRIHLINETDFLVACKFSVDHNNDLELTLFVQKEQL